MNTNKSGIFDKYMYDRKSLDRSKLMFTNSALKALIIPLVLEQFLNMLMGIADMLMVSRVGEAAISAVSNVDQLNFLMIQVFSALATGAVIICSQYLGRDDRAAANRTAKQVVLTVAAISTAIMVMALLACKPLLSFLFGRVEQVVMNNSIDYFYLTVLSFPALALFSAGAAFFRAEGNAKFPMKVSVIGNLLNVGGNAFLIFVCNMGVRGAALSTLLSRIFCMVVVFYFLRKPKQIIVINDLVRIRPDFNKIKFILAVGIPAGVENGMFELGKLAIQSSVATLSTNEMAAQAMAIKLEALSGMAGIGIGLGMMTVVGQCIGAGRINQARYYMVKLTAVGWLSVLISCIAIYAATPLFLWGGDMNAESSRICKDMVLYITLIKPVVWTFSFIPAYGIRAAGDIKFSMIASSIIMWTVRVALCIYLIRVAGMGPIAVWIAMSIDWTLRAIIFSWRYLSGRWADKCTI